MSGGSYDYLCRVESDEVFGRWNSLREMAARLDGLCPEAAAETRLFAEGPATLLTAVETHLERLKPLWKAVEWHDSGDWGDDQLAEAMQEYRELPPAPGQVDGADRIHRIRELVAQASGSLNEALNVTLADAGALPPSLDELRDLLLAIYQTTGWQSLKGLPIEQRELWADVIDARPGAVDKVSRWWQE